MHEDPATIVRERFHGAEARAKLLEGVDAVADAVKVTMGAKGRTVITSYGHATKDGVTVARDVELFENQAVLHGARLIKESSVKTCDQAGDGTSSVCVLVQHMIREGLRKIEQGKDPQDLKREMESVKDDVLKAFEGQKLKDVDLLRVASISANDDELGKIVSEAIEKVGENGLVTVEKTYGEMEIEVSNGMQLDRGLIAGPFLTDGQRRKAEHENVLVLLYKGKLHDLMGIKEALEPVLKSGHPVLIIADDYEQDVHMALVRTAANGAKLMPIKSPRVRRDESFEDLAVYTGATVVTESDGFKNFDRSLFGQVKKVIASPEKTTIQCEDREEQIMEQVGAIEEYAKKFATAEKKEIEKRISRLLGKVGIIKLPEVTEAEGREIRYRVEDAIEACQGAKQEGIVPGCGYAYLAASQALKTHDTDGAKLVAEALEAPMRQILRNAGKHDEGLIDEAKKGYIVNLLTSEAKKADKTDVVDPLKVVRTAFENALSVSLIALTTEVLIADRKRLDSDIA